MGRLVLLWVLFSPGLALGLWREFATPLVGGWSLPGGILLVNAFGEAYWSPEGRGAAWGRAFSRRPLGMAWGGEVWVAVGEGGLLAAARGPLRWEELPLPAGGPEGWTPTLRGVVRTPTGYVAVGDGGTVLLSREGWRWRWASRPPRGDLLGVAWGPAGLVAVAHGGGVWFSRDGETWTEVHQAEDTLLGVTWGPGGYVAVGLMGRVVRSADGQGWEEVAFPDGRVLVEARAVPGGYLVVDEGGTGHLWTGEGWRRLRGPPGEYLHGNTLMAGGGVVWAGTLVLEYRLRGGEWERVPFSEAPLTSLVAEGPGARVEVRGGRLWVAVGPGEARPLALGNLPPLRGVAYGGGRFVAVGDGGTALVSLEGTRWVPGRTGTLGDLLAVAWTGEGFVATGRGGTVLGSREGLTWVPLRAPGPFTGLGVGRVGGETRVRLGMGVLLRPVGEGPSLGLP